MILLFAIRIIQKFILTAR